MGSATREALTVLRDALATQSLDVPAAEDLFSVARLLGSSSQLRSAATEASADAEEKTTLLTTVLGGKIAPAALGLVTLAAAQRWSTSDDVVEGLEETGVRALAASGATDTSISNELFAFASAVTSDPELELALRSRLADPQTKAVLVDRLLTAATPQTRAIVRQLVVDSRGRGIRDSLRWASQIVADQRGIQLAVVTSAVPVTSAQLDRFRKVLSARYGRDLVFNHIIDPSLIGGLRVQIGDDVIDSSIATRLNDVRLALA